VAPRGNCCSLPFRASADQRHWPWDTGISAPPGTALGGGPLHISNRYALPGGPASTGTLANIPSGKRANRNVRRRCRSNAPFLSRNTHLLFRNRRLCRVSANVPETARLCRNSRNSLKPRNSPWVMHGIPGGLCHAPYFCEGPSWWVEEGHRRHPVGRLASGKSCRVIPRIPQWSSDPRSGDGEHPNPAAS
jgi:hypothetical protein